MNFLVKQEETHREQIYDCQGKDRVCVEGQLGFGMDMCTLLYLKWITNNKLLYSTWNFSLVQLLSRVRLFVTWITARQASLSITNSRSSLRLTSIVLVMPSSHLILCHPLLLLPPIPPSIRVFSNESTVRMR